MEAASYGAVNGLDVRRASNNSGQWYRLNVVNNMVVDNIAGMAGSGISLPGSARQYRNNTIALTTARQRLGRHLQRSEPVYRATSEIIARPQHAVVQHRQWPQCIAVQARVLNRRCSATWHNRSFYWFINDSTDPATGWYRTSVPWAAICRLAVLGTSNPANQLDASAC
jgi:hypothetical protein